MGRTRWIVGGGVGVAAIAGLLGGGWLVTRLPGRLEALARDQLRASVDADVSWGAVSPSWGALPRLGVTVKDVVVANRGDFAGTELARIGSATVVVDPWAVLASDVSIRRVSAKDVKVDLRVDRKGRANWDVTKDDGSSEPSSLSLVLDRLEASGVDVEYRDESARIGASVKGLELDGTASWKGSVAAMRGRIGIADLDLHTGRTHWLRDSRWSVDADASYDTATGGMTLASTKVRVNDLPLSIDGSLAPKGAGWVTDLRFAAEETGFGPLLSLVPRAYAGSMQGVKTSGTAALQGWAKGVYEGDTWPGFEVSLEVRDAAYGYPSLPEVSGIGVKARVTHAEGPSASTALDLDELALTAGGSPFTVRGGVKQMFGDPRVDGSAKGRLDLGALSRSLPTPEGTEVSAGALDIDVAIAGARSDFEAPNPRKVKANGTIRGKGVRVVTDAFPLPVTFDELDLTLSPQTAELRSLATRFGDSDLSVAGRLDNLVGYALGGEVLTGTLALRSKQLDLRPLQGRDSEAGTTDEEGLIVAVPTDLDLAVTNDFRRVTTRRLELRDVTGTMRIANGVASLQDLGATTLGGRATISGRYAAPTARTADLDLSVDAVSMNVGDTFAAFATLRRIVPVLEKLSGQYDSGFTLRTKLSNDGTPDLDLTRSAGRVAPTGSLRTAAFSPAEKKLGPAAGKGFGAVELGGNALQYLLQQGTLDLSPFEVKLGGMPATLQGTASVADQKMNLTVALQLPSPVAALGGGKGPQDVVIRLKGPWSSPDVTVKLAGEDPIDAAKDLVSAAAKEQADAILAEARRAADELLGAADAKAKKVVKAADNPAEKALAEAAAKEIRSTARKAADELLAKAQKKADALLAGGGADAGGKKGGGKGGGKGRKK